jgi:hypothetical protein
MYQEFIMYYKMIEFRDYGEPFCLNGRRFE